MKHLPIVQILYGDISRKNLALVSELNDKAAQGRVFGNLGNTYYLLGDFDKAIHYHMQVSSKLFAKLSLTNVNYYEHIISQAYHCNFQMLPVTLLSLCYCSAGIIIINIVTSAS